MAYPQSIPNDGSTLNDKLKEFFTYRPGQPDYVNGPDPNYEQWGWLEIYPQHKYLPKVDGSCEEVPVGVTQYDIYVEKNKMEIKLSRNSFNVMDKNLNFEFKLSDNMQEVGNIMDFYVNGDVAPGGGFNFVYSEK